MKRILIIIIVVCISMNGVLAADSTQLLSQKIDAYVLSQGRENRKKTLTVLHQVVLASQKIQSNRKQDILSILTKNLKVYTNEKNSGLKQYGLSTDTSIRSIPLDQIRDGGPGKDGIPALSYPSFISIQEAQSRKYVRDNLEGMVLTSDEGSNPRFYPFSILNWHEIVNDVIDEVPIAITYCPLCGTAITYDRRIGGSVLEFGVSGLLYESNLLMYDDSTESLWSQAFGKAMLGQYTDYELVYHPSQQMKFKQFVSLYPQGIVMSDSTGYNRDYMIGSPYGSYDESDALYFPTGYRDSQVSPKRRMIVVNDPRGFSVAFDRKDLLQHGTASIKVSSTITITAYVEKDVIIVIEDGANRLPHFVEMWFSRSARNQGSNLWRKFQPN